MLMEIQLIDFNEIHCENLKLKLKHNQTKMQLLFTNSINKEQDF